jgi:hypothetical protein
MLAVVLAALLLALPAQAGQMSLLGAGKKASGGGGASFTGMGDAKSGAKGHWGVIAYSAATRGSNMLELCNVGDAACANVATDATTGLVSSTQVIGGTTCGTTGGVDVCTIKTLYDDSGANNCTGACDLVNATIGTRPVFVPNFVGSVPAIRCNAAAGSFAEKSSGFTSLSQPVAWATAFSIDDDPGANQRTWSAGATGVVTGSSSGRLPFFYSGSLLNESAITVNTMYAIIGTQEASGSNGTIVVNDTTPATGAVGNAASGTSITVCADFGGGNAIDAKTLEGAIYNAALSSGDITALTNAMRANGGY